MKYIESLYHFAQNYWFLTVIVGLLASFLESFIPILPLTAIVGANAVLLGMFGGFTLSFIGSGLGTTLLFLILKKYNNNKMFNKLKNNKMDRFMEWIKGRGFKLIFISYACPFIPSSLVTVASSLCNMDSKTFIPGMLSGKFIMFLFISYPASNIMAFITSPTKIIIFLVLAFLSWKIGNKIKTSLEGNDKKDLENLENVKRY